MALSWKDRIKQAVSSGGTGALTLGAAESGYQAFAAGDNALLFGYVIEDGTAWETGYGTYTHSGTSFARTSRTASSTGSALNVSTSAFLFVDVVSSLAQGMDLAAQAVAPGGRLTLESGVPVSTTDQAAKTTIYYAPYVNNIIVLWDGNRWQPVTFAETSLAIGTVTADLGFDVFGYLSSGALAVEKLAWTSATARATALSLEDGRYCKSGDKTRLYLGSFYSNTTTTTEDSLNCRFVYNAYNKVSRAGYASELPTAFSYSTSAFRDWRGLTYATGSSAYSNWFFGEIGALSFNVSCTTDGTDHIINCSVNGVSTGAYSRIPVAASYLRLTCGGSAISRLGLNNFIVSQYGGGNASNWRDQYVWTKAMA